MLTAMTAMTARSEEFNEVDLLGKWDVVSQTGNISDGLLSFDAICFGRAFLSGDNEIEFNPNGYVQNVVYISGKLDWESFDNMSDFENSNYIGNNDYCMLRDFFISNGNKLHIDMYIIYGDKFRFVIESLTDNEMVLTNFTGDCRMVLRKADGGSSVEKITVEDTTGNTGYYTVDGRKVEHPSGGLYIHKSADATEKVLIK